METKNIVQNLEIPVVIGVSGGVDSMVLLYLAMQQLPRNAIIVAHFDHGLRGADSDGDRIFVEKFCHENSLIFEAETKNIAENIATNFLQKYIKNTMLMRFALRIIVMIGLKARCLTSFVEPNLVDL